MEFEGFAEGSQYPIHSGDSGGRAIGCANYDPIIEMDLRARSLSLNREGAGESSAFYHVYDIEKVDHGQVAGHHRYGCPERPRPCSPSQWSGAPLVGGGRRGVARRG